MPSRALLDVVQGEVSPADRAVSQVIALFQLNPGDVVLHASVMKITLGSTGNTMSLGDGSGVTRFTAAVDTSTGAAGDRVDGTTAAFPYMYLVADNLDVDYIAIGGGGTIIPKARFYALILRSGRF